MTEMKKTLERIYMALIVIFMYAPIVLLIIQSFNKSKSRARWGGFTLDWYRSLFTDASIGEAFTNTILLALLSSVISVILGTAAVKDPAFLKEAVDTYGRQIAVGADIRDGYVSIKGWTEQSGYTLEAFCREMQELGVKTLICTDISRDGAMRGTNRELYRKLSETYTMDITASGGVSTLDDVRALAAMDLYGCIIGKAYYTGDIKLPEALAIAGKQV
jgi:phosphoribosylformimino-5-aminoimidazole carboxamide ribotide isomerase